MELNIDVGQGHYHIRGYGKGFIQVNDQKIYHSIIISSERLINPWPPQSLADLSPPHFEPLLTLHPSLVLLGTGQQFSFPNPILLAEFYHKKIGIEVMDTGAACRTYMALMAEGRQVAAALLIP